MSEQGEDPDRYQDSSIVVVEKQPTYDLPDLSIWIGHRILARRSDHYFSSGVIDRIVERSGDTLVVVLDMDDGTPLVYSNVLSRESYGNIISDAIPATKQVSSVLILDTESFFPHQTVKTNLTDLTFNKRKLPIKSNMISYHWGSYETLT